MPATGVTIIPPSGLTRAAKERRLCFFLGAGFSRNVHPKIPEASGLFRTITSYAEIDERLIKVHFKNDLQLLGEYLELTGKIEQAIGSLNVFFQNSEFNVSESDPHYYLTQIDSEYIFTTNWDHCIEDAHTAHNAEFFTVRRPVDLLEIGYKSAHKKIIKYHGDFDYPKDVIFSTRSYIDRIKNPSPIDHEFIRLLFSNSFLFIGYSFSDPNLKFLWYQMHSLWASMGTEYDKEKRPSSYLVATERNPIIEAWLSNIGITVIHITPAPDSVSESISDLLEAIQLEQ